MDADQVQMAFREVASLIVPQALAEQIAASENEARDAEQHGRRDRERPWHAGPWRRGTAWHARTPILRRASLGSRHPAGWRNTTHALILAPAPKEILSPELQPPAPVRLTLYAPNSEPHPFVQ